MQTRKLTWLLLPKAHKHFCCWSCEVPEPEMCSHGNLNRNLFKCHTFSLEINYYSFKECISLTALFAKVLKKASG